MTEVSEQPIVEQPERNCGGTDDKVIEKYKKALEKMVRAYDAQKEKLIERNEEIEHLKKENANLSEMVKKYIDGEQETKLNKENVEEILALVKVGGVNWACYRTSHGMEWDRSESLMTGLSNIMEKFTLPQEIDLSEIETINKNGKGEKILFLIDSREIIAKEAMTSELADTIKQYEARFKQMQTHFEENESRLARLNEKNKDITTQMNKFHETWTNFTSYLIDKSVEIRENALVYLNEEIDNLSKGEAMAKMKAVIIALQQMTFEKDFNGIADLRDHLLLLHETLFDSLKRLANSQAELNQQEKTWRGTCDTLLKEKEEERREKIDVVEVGRKKMKDLELKFDNLKMESQKMIKERDLNIEYLSQELRKNVNTQYIKNIVMNFFSGDSKVQEKLIPVFGNVLQFTSDELEEFKKAWEASLRPTFIKKLFSNPFVNKP